MIAGYDYRFATPKPDVWPEDFQSLESTHNMVVTLALPEYVPQSIDDVVGVFSLDEISQSWKCVGQAYPMDILGHRRYFVTVFGHAVDAGSAIRFRWYSEFTDGILEAREVELFAPDGLTGTIDEPLELHFRIGDDIESDAVDFEYGTVLEVYPNPMTSSLDLYYHGTETVEQIRLEDISGKLISLLDCPEIQVSYNVGTVRDALCTWELSGLSNGVYVIRIVTDQGSKRVRILKM
jgi:hypothetical protein